MAEEFRNPFSILGENANGKDLEEIKADILGHPLIKEFIEKYEAVITYEMLQEGLANMAYYIRCHTQEPRIEAETVYLPSLVIRNRHIDLEHKLRPEKVALMNKHASKRRLEFSSMSEGNKQAELSNLANEMGMALAKGEAERIIAEYQDGKKVKGMWLVGSYGIGKSYLACALAKELHKKLAGVIVVPPNELVDELKGEMSRDSASGKIDKRLKQLEEVDVLILDDIGAEALSDWYVDAVLYRIVDARYKHNKLTIFTSNLTRHQYYETLKGIRGKLDQRAKDARARRVIERIIAMTNEVQALGDNKRYKPSA